MQKQSRIHPTYHNLHSTDVEEEQQAWIGHIFLEKSFDSAVSCWDRRLIASRTMYKSTIPPEIHCSSLVSIGPHLSRWEEHEQMHSHTYLGTRRYQHHLGVSGTHRRLSLGRARFRLRGDQTLSKSSDGQVRNAVRRQGELASLSEHLP